MRCTVPTPAEELLAEYEAREREGPDFMRIRPGSVIADAPVVTLDLVASARLPLRWAVTTTFIPIERAARSTIYANVSCYRPARRRSAERAT
jgi:hypothetical protein